MLKSVPVVSRATSSTTSATLFEIWKTATPLKKESVEVELEAEPLVMIRSAVAVVSIIDSTPLTGLRCIETETSRVDATEVVTPPSNTKLPSVYHVRTKAAGTDGAV